MNMENNEKYSIEILKRIAIKNFLEMESRAKLKEAVETLTTALKEDKDYYNSWQANIAISFKDAYDNEWDNLNKYVEGVPNKPDIHIVANRAAENFLNLLISL